MAFSVLRLGPSYFKAGSYLYIGGEGYVPANGVYPLVVSRKKKRLIWYLLVNYNIAVKTHDKYMIIAC